MKIIHTADLHLGMRPDRGQPWSDERSEALWQTFRFIVRTTKEKRADLLLIAGDLFHRQPLARELKEADSLLASLAPTPVVLIAGNHDCLSPHSHYRNFTWSDNVIFIDSPRPDSVLLSDLGVVIHGFSYHQAEVREALCDHLHVPNDGYIHILLAHGGDAGHVPMDKQRLAAAGFHYAALGHIHKPQLCEDLRLAWCGSPEPLDCTDTGSRGFIEADVTRSRTRLTFIPSATASYIPLSVTVNAGTTREKLALSLEKAMASGKGKRYYVITIHGERNMDTDFSTPLSLPCPVARWEDRTHIAVDYDRLSSEHSGDLLGQFISEMRRQPPGPLRDRALAFGVRACLGEEAQQ